MTCRACVATLVLLLAALWMAPTMVGAQNPPAGPAASRAAAADLTYVLGAADVVEVSIPGRTDFTTRARINDQGIIQLPFIGPIAAADKTTAQLSDDVSRALGAGGYFAHPVVTVEIVSYASKYVTVLGEFTFPGLVPVDRPYRLSDVIAKVGGVRDGGADYVVLRPAHGPEQRLPVVTLATGDLGQDPFVAPGDKIYCPKADLFYISGQVTQPGTYAVSTGMTIRLAIARGGGVNAEGTLGKVSVTRRGKKLTGHDLNRLVEPGDIIVVGERLF